MRSTALFWLLTEACGEGDSGMWELGGHLLCRMAMGYISIAYDRAALG